MFVIKVSGINSLFKLKLFPANVEARNTINVNSIPQKIRLPFVFICCSPVFIMYCYFYYLEPSIYWQFTDFTF